jgi:hypothetical protein
MELTKEQIKAIEELAATNWDPEKIAHYLDVDREEFLMEFHNPESELRYRYDRGQLIAQADIDRSNLKRARDGNLTSIAQYKKDFRFRQIDNAKKKVEFDKLKTEYAQLQALVERGEVTDLPEEMVKYLEQMDYIRSLYLKWNSRNYIISMVILKWPQITRQKADELYADTLNFFYLDNQVKTEAWQNIYADRLDQIAALAFEMNDLETGRRLTIDAAKMRGVGKENPPEIPPGMYERRPVVYILDPKMFGIDKVDRRQLAEFLDTLDISVLERDKLRRDAGIEDAYFEIIEPKEDAQDQNIEAGG